MENHAQGEPNNEDFEDVANMDGAVFDGSDKSSIDTGIEKDFLCINPTLESGHIKYTCKGVDADGSWEGQRRFNEFFILREKLEQRWPGVPLPSLPPKKSTGNKELKFINQRRYYLERFLKKLSQFDFIINSNEFRIFSRPQGSIETQFKTIRKPMYHELVPLLRAGLKIDDTTVDFNRRSMCELRVKEFQSFSITIIPVLRNLTKKVCSYMTGYSEQLQNTKVHLTCLDKYEAINLLALVDQDSTKLVFQNGMKSGSEYAEQPTDATKRLNASLKNPYFSIYHWCRGEIADLEAVRAACTELDRVNESMNKRIAKKRSAQEDIDNVTVGKKTIKTAFKNPNDTIKMAAEIEAMDREIDSLQIIHGLILIYLGEQCIPQLKSGKAGLYKNVIKTFNSIMMTNANNTADFWGNIISNENVKSQLQQQA